MSEGVLKRMQATRFVGSVAVVDQDFHQGSLAR